MQIHQYNDKCDTFVEFRIHCEACSGLCCVALYFSKYDGFPADKAAGTPCRNLGRDFKCIIHKELGKKKMKGCLAYDCCGAGQLVTALYGERNWSSDPQDAQEIYDVFVKTFYLQQMLWYLTEVMTLLPARPLWKQAESCITQLSGILQTNPKEILNFGMEEFGPRANALLKNAGELVQTEACHGKPGKAAKKKEYIGYQFKKAPLHGQDFSSTLMIAADLEGCSLTGSNFLGADLRDTNLKNADLRESIFLTQGQLNSAKGNKNTRIPHHLSLPAAWNSDK